MKHLRGEKRFYYGMTVLVLVFIIAGLTSNLEGGVRGNRQEKEAFDQKPEEVQTEQENQGEETQVVSNPNIRVLLMTDGYKNTIHPSVTVSSTSGLSITYGETVEECEAGMEVTFMPDDSRFQSGNIRIQAKEGEITVNSLKRGYGIPSYQGILELRTTAEGIAIINELPVENYLCRVVPSECRPVMNRSAESAGSLCQKSTPTGRWQNMDIRNMKLMWMTVRIIRSTATVHRQTAQIWLFRRRQDKSCVWTERL